MDYPKDNVFTFLFSTYRRTSGVVFTAIIILAVPITILLLETRQDIRQRAADNSPVIDQKQSCDSLASQIALLEQTGRCGAQGDNSCHDVKARYSLLNCDGSQGICIPKPQNCKNPVTRFLSLWTGACLEPDNGWCSEVTPPVLGAQDPVQSACPLARLGDNNCDGKLNTDDFNIWRENFVNNVK